MAFDPISASVELAGLATSIYGGMKSYEGAKKQASATQNEIGIETQQDNVRRQAMELSAHRNLLQNVRTQQVARSMALNNATNQGAQFGSGLQGGIGAISGQSGVNQLGITQNLGFGEQMFDLNSQLNQQKIAYSQAGTDVAYGQGISAIGKGLSGSAGGIGNLFGSFGPSSGGSGEAGQGKG